MGISRARQAGSLLKKTLLKIDEKYTDF